MFGERTEPYALAAAFLREITGEEFTAKDFRRWAGTALALQEFEAFDSEAEAKHREAGLNKEGLLRAV